MAAQRSAMSKVRYKYCLVPGCRHTTFTAAEKTFIQLPSERKLRLLWLKAMRRNPEDISKKTMGFVCEDHFHLEDDLENFIRFKYYGGKVKLKPSVVPHIFKCQLDRKCMHPKRKRHCSDARARKSLISALEEADSEETEGDKGFLEESEGDIRDAAEGLCLLSNSAQLEESDVIFEPSSTQRGSPGQGNIGPHATDAAIEPFCSPSTSNFEAMLEKSEFTLYSAENQRDFSSQVNIRPQFRSKKIQCRLLSVKDIACSPIKNGQIQSSSYTQIGNSQYSSEDSISSDSEGDSSEIEEEYSEEESESDELPCILVTQNELNLNVRLYMSDTKFYLGLPQASVNVVNIIADTVKCGVTGVLLTLKKIKLDSTFKELGYNFGCSESCASRIFSKNTPLISSCLSELIYWPKSEDIKSNLPLPFRARFSHVQSIIDCYEIQIEKPTNPTHQALTWSNYKKANTIKFLISATPDGLINFLSDGYGGRATDVSIVKDCGYLNELPDGCEVMADRGFKGIDHLLAEKGCRLVRPPSVKVGEKCSKADVIYSKRIASLRIHIERVIGRLREFKMLKPNACIDRNLVVSLSYVNKIAAGLINLQNKIIKKCD
ncbi:uncharacterized protein LOC124165410 [Ischnura elegans]|uniref:uncharacterized protein LOC124165410 n=1 Tax=Ischnura elegans TaxID=197161 RepID=UPI001ED870BA|nr:uncharacterized protein LOC124165410 [Ischnura elegans]